MIINWTSNYQEYYGSDIIVFRCGGHYAVMSIETVFRFNSGLERPPFKSISKTPGFHSSLKKPEYKGLL